MYECDHNNSMGTCNTARSRTSIGVVFTCMLLNSIPRKGSIQYAGVIEEIIINTQNTLDVS